MNNIQEKRYFLKNANIMKEIHNSKITYCCYDNDDYTMYDIICDGYDLITPNDVLSFFTKNPDRDYIVIRVMTDEHVLAYCKTKNGKVNLQELKMSPFKHFLLKKKDFNKVFESCSDSLEIVKDKLDRIKELKEKIKDNKKNIRFNKLNKALQVPYKLENAKHLEEIDNLVEEIKQASKQFTTKIKSKLKEVLRSHWKGDTIKNGDFCVEHGRLTDGLVHMIIMLVDQYAKSGNWSGYTYVQEMKNSALCHLCEVVLKFEELESNNPFSYITQATANKFTATLNSEHNQSMIKSRLLQRMGYDPTYNEQVNEEYKYKQEEWEASHND